jgi:hypothetical protein
MPSFVAGVELVAGTGAAEALATGVTDRLWPVGAGLGAGLALHPASVTAASRPSRLTIRLLTMVICTLPSNPQLTYRRRAPSLGCTN